ncbi:hypothetical protein M0805_009216 [Coniferiporia weirii]|nr:hypothetical protein M0805_009216 [Coniferiporia weirii]
MNVLATNFTFTREGDDLGLNTLEDIGKAGMAELKLHEVNTHTDTLDVHGLVERMRLTTSFSANPMASPHHLQYKQHMLDEHLVMLMRNAISVFSSDSEAMGHVGEVVSRRWCTARKMCGPLEGLGDVDGRDNGRMKRYISKWRPHGYSHFVGSVAVGQLADLVLWKPENFSAKPEHVFKSGVIARAQGERRERVNPNPDLRIRYAKRTLNQRRAQLRCVRLVNKHLSSAGQLQSRGTARHKCAEAVHGKHDMKWNNHTPRMRMVPET